MTHRTLFEDVHCLEARRSAERAIRKRPRDDRLNLGASLIVISLLSLGLWAGIWEAVAFFISDGPR